MTSIEDSCFLVKSAFIALVLLWQHTLKYALQMRIVLLVLAHNIYSLSCKITITASEQEMLVSACTCCVTNICTVNIYLELNLDCVNSKSTFIGDAELVTCVCEFFSLHAFTRVVPKVSNFTG